MNTSQRLLIVGKPVEAFPSKMHAGVVQFPACILFNSSIAASPAKRDSIDMAILPWPQGVRLGSLKSILQEN